METKPFYQSKTFWVNLIAGVAMVVQGVNGNWVLSPEHQAYALTAVNIILRFVTKGKVTF